MKHILSILLLLAATAHGADVVLGRVADLTWGGSGADRVATFGNGDVTSGLIAWYKMDEGTGTSLADEIYGNTATLTLGAGSVWTTGVSGAAVYMAGNSVATFPTNEALHNLTNVTTWMAWIYSDTPNFNGGIVGRWLSGAEVANSILIYQGQDAGNDKITAALWQSNDGAVYAIGSMSISSAWTHVAATADGTSLRLYINGVLGAQGSYDGTIKSGHSTIPTVGRLRSIDDLYSYKGRIDEVRVYSRALSSNEVYQIWNATK